MRTMLNQNLLPVLVNKSSQRLRNQQLPSHLYQKDSLDIIHKQKEKDQLMHLSKLFQVLEEDDKIVPQDYCLQKLQQKVVKPELPQRKKRIMDKFQNIFKKWTKQKKKISVRELHREKTLKLHQELEEWEMMKKQQWFQN